MSIRGDVEKYLLDLNKSFGKIKDLVMDLPIDTEAKEEALNILKSHIETARHALCDLYERPK